VCSSSLAAYGWTYDAAGRLTRTVSADGTTDYAYDDLGQLTGADSDYRADESYAYDAAGNRTGGGYSTGDANRLLSDGTYDYEYDDEGRRTKRTEIASGDYALYEWDHGGRLTGIASFAAVGTLTKSVAYAYDGWGRRIGKDVDDDGDGLADRGERFVWDGPGGFGHVDDVVLTFDESGNLEHRYLRGPGADQVFADETGTGEVLWALADHQGTVRDWAERDAGTGTTAVTNHLTFDSFGQILSQTDATHAVVYAYTGREWDGDAELYYYRARWYDAGVGRFASEDPLGFEAGDANLQRYVGNGVPNANDPSGLDAAHAWQWHHLLPKEVFDGSENDLLKRNGLNTNINSKEYGWMLQGKDHQGSRDLGTKGVHPEWNSDWKKWIEKNKGTFSQKDLDKQVDLMKKKYGLTDDAGKALKGTPAEMSWKDWQAKLKAAREAAEKKAERELAEKAERELAEKAERELAEKAEREAGESLLGRLAKRGAKRGGKALGAKCLGPLTMVPFFAYDWYSGGFGHAVNEATWPVSEGWRKDGMLD
jgi:RHS repeat-associated protein